MKVKSEIEYNVTEIKYPCLRIIAEGPSRGAIVFFKEPSRGYVVHSGGVYFIGYESTCWVMGCFVPFDGYIKHLHAEIERLDKDLDTAIQERDMCHEWADKLAYAIADESVIGEHSNCNNPWANALFNLLEHKQISKLNDGLCDGFMEGRRTFGFMERCDCRAKYRVTQKNGPLERFVCGRHVQTFRAGIRQGRKYVIVEITT